MDLFSSNGKLVGRISTGQDVFGLHLDGRSFYGTLNGCRITESDTRKKFTDRSAPVIAMAVVEVGKQNPIQVNRSDKDQNAMEDILKSLGEKVDESKMTVLTLPPDEQQGNTPREMKASAPDLSSYYKALPAFAEPVNKCRDLSDSLLRTNIPKTMWGSKKVQGFLTGVKADLEGMKSDFDRFEVVMEHTERDIRVALATKDRKSMSAAAGRLIDGFRDTKTVMIRTAQATHKLFDADKTFKSASGYPATWFFPPSVFYDFLYNYEGLVKGIVKAASVETTAIMPLFAWRVQVGDQR